MPDNLRGPIRKKAESMTAPDGRPMLVITERAVRKIAAAAGASGREVEIAALGDNVVPLRYQRNVGTIGVDGQARLLEGRVAIIGAGGLGGTVFELLCRAGVGRIRIVDDDVFTDDNLNRQILSGGATLGKPKAEAAVRRAAEINPSVETEAVIEMLDGDNAHEILDGCDAAVDGLDTIPARLALQEAAGALGIPMVSAAIAGSVGYVMTVFPGDRGWKGFFGTGCAPVAGVEREIGNPAPTPAVAAALEAQEVLKILTGKGTPLSGGFLFFDTENNEYMFVSDNGEIE